MQLFFHLFHMHVVNQGFPWSRNLFDRFDTKYLCFLNLLHNLICCLPSLFQYLWRCTGRHIWFQLRDSLMEVLSYLTQSNNFSSENISSVIPSSVKLLQVSVIYASSRFLSSFLFYALLCVSLTVCFSAEMVLFDVFNCPNIARSLVFISSTAAC